MLEYGRICVEVEEFSSINKVIKIQMSRRTFPVTGERGKKLSNEASTCALQEDGGAGIGAADRGQPAEIAGKYAVHGVVASNERRNSSVSSSKKVRAIREIGSREEMLQKQVPAV
ncbi:hypothetical protein MRB53_006605 [Persea americana]|uniref:Uncharacterized protein n=1 Tax=Persea americana TaxID=3435 RepID=A0ACC2MGM3_PERAE|nr:hypothetical protein MRB53_006605 [Persea americana]